MCRSPIRPMAVLFLSVLLFLLAAAPAHAQGVEEVEALNKQTAGFAKEGKFAEAAKAAERAVAAADRSLPPQHPKALTALNNLAELYRAQKRCAEAEPVYRRGLDTATRALGRDHADSLGFAFGLAECFDDAGRYADAEPLYKRVFEGRDRTLGPEHPQTLSILNKLALTYDALARYGEAEPLYRRALATFERLHGPEDRNTLSIVNNLGLLFHHQDRLAEAEAFYKRALKARTRILGPDHSSTLTTLSNLAGLYGNQARYDEAEAHYKRALAAKERTLGVQHPSTLSSLNNLAEIYRVQDRHGEAEPLIKRAFEGRERVLGTNHPETLAAANNLALVYKGLGRLGEAAPILKGVLEGRERMLGRDHPETLFSVNNLASLYENQGRRQEAEALFKRALEGFERTRGSEHRNTLVAINNLASLYNDTGRFKEAERLYKRALDGAERALGREHPLTLTAFNNLAVAYFAQSDWSGAARYWTSSTAGNAARTRRGDQGALEAEGMKKSGEVQHAGWQFAMLVKSVHRAEGQAPSATAGDEMFQAAQWASGSEAAQSLAKMAARGAKGDAALAALARERQDLADQWQRLDALRTAALGRAASERNAKTEAENSTKLAALDERIATIDRRLNADFPEYYALASPAPLSIAQVQALLGPDEALVLFLDTKENSPAPEETFIWAVTKTQMRWVRSDLGRSGLAREVSALRCGLDSAAWTKPSKCPELTGQKQAGAELPFDTARAHRLYMSLFAGIKDVVAGKHLLVVPSGALTQLPFQVLVTAPPADRNLKTAAWLTRDQALTVLPAVSSLKALRSGGQGRTAAKPLIGFGNPLLGTDNDPALQLARQKQSCEKLPSPQTAGSSLARRVGTTVRMRNGLADLAELHNAPPLPETADELCAVAREVGAQASDILLGSRATETAVKELSGRGALAQYRIVHFATHGVMSGELKSAAEPGLVMTPPREPSELDDGYLTASEIAALKLDADWVVLSACNTAAGNAPNAEALSGLGRAFLYAQARALLVSHWAVASDATVKLITSAMGQIARESKIGRAEALRRAMLAMVDSGNPLEAHPAYWAPFVVVGEGAR